MTPLRRHEPSVPTLPAPNQSPPPLPPETRIPPPQPLPPVRFRLSSPPPSRSLYLQPFHRRAACLSNLPARSSQPRSDTEWWAGGVGCCVLAQTAPSSGAAVEWRSTVSSTPAPVTWEARRRPTRSISTGEPGVNPEGVGRGAPLTPGSPVLQSQVGRLKEVGRGPPIGDSCLAPSSRVTAGGA